MTASSGEPAPAPGAGTSEGPLAHAARAVAERSYLDALDRLHQQGWERASGGRPEPMSKRWLVALSHAIEKAVMSGPIETPTVIIAMFQRLEFFDRERDVYARMAAAGLEVVIGFIEDEAHETPPGVHSVLLRPDEALADEWTVVAVGPRAGAFLVATDQHRIDPDEREYQASRQFTGRWGFSRTQAAGELARLRFALGERLTPTLRRTIDGLLAQVMPIGEKSADSAGAPGEMWATTSLYHLIDRMQSVRAGNRDLREQLADASMPRPRVPGRRRIRPVACPPPTSSTGGRSTRAPRRCRSASPCSTSPPWASRSSGTTAARPTSWPTAWPRP